MQMPFAEGVRPSPTSAGKDQRILNEMMVGAAMEMAHIYP